MAATATALVDVTVLGETFVITVDRNHGTVDALAEEAYEQYHACYPDEPVQAILFIRDAAGRIVNGKLRVLDLTGHSHGHGPGPGQSSLNRFEVVVGQRKHAAPSSSSSSSSSRTGRADPHAPHDDGPDEQLVEVKVYEETFLIAADRDTTVTALATKAYEEYRMSYPEAVMKRILLVRDEAGRVVSGNLRVLRLGSSNSNSSGGGGGGGRRFDVEVDEHPWTEEVLAVDDIDAAYRNWQLTTARSVASMIYHLCTAPLDAPSPDALPAAPSLSRAAAAAAATKQGAAMGTDENVSRVRAALDLVAELQASTSQPVQLSCLESLRLLLMLHDDLSVVDAAFHLLRRAFMDAVRVETAIAALRALRDAIETTAVVLSKETLAALNIDVARSKFPAHRAELSRLFGFLMMRAPVDASAAVSRPASRMAGAGAGAGAGLSKQSSVDTMMTLTSVAGRTEATMLYDTNRALQPSMPLQPEFLAPEFRNRTKMLPAGGPGGARADADATAQSVGRLVALLSSPTPSLRRSALRKLRRALSALAGAARAEPYFADTAGDGDDDTYAFTAATQFQFEDVALALRSEAGLAAVASCLLRGLKRSLHTPGKRPPLPQEEGSPGSGGAFPRLEGAYDVGGALRATEGGPLPPPQPWLGVDRGATDPWGGGEPPTRRTFLQAHSKAARLVEATVASPLTDGESAHLALVCVWQLHRLAAGGAAAAPEVWPGGAGRGLSEAFSEAKDGGEGLLLPGPGPRPGPGPGGGRGRGKGSAVLDACADHARLLLTLAHVEPVPADAYAHGGGWGAGSPLRGDAGDAGERPTLACLGGALVRALACARGGWAHAAAPGGPPLRVEDHAVRCFLLDYLRALVGPGPASEPHSAALTASAAYPHAFPTGTVPATRGRLFGPPGGAGAFTVAGVGAAAVPPACAERAALALLYLQHLAEGAGAGAGGEQQHPRQARGPGPGTGASAGTLSMAGQYSGVEALVTLDRCQVLDAVAALAGTVDVNVDVEASVGRSAAWQGDGGAPPAPAADTGAVPAVPMRALECLSVLSALGAAKARLWAGADVGTDAVGALVAVAERAAAAVGPQATAAAGGAPAHALTVIQLVVKTFAHVYAAATTAAAAAMEGEGEGGGDGQSRAKRLPRRLPASSRGLEADPGDALGLASDGGGGAAWAAGVREVRDAYAARLWAAVEASVAAKKDPVVRFYMNMARGGPVSRGGVRGARQPSSSAPATGALSPEVPVPMEGLRDGDGLAAAGGGVAMSTRTGGGNGDGDGDAAGPAATLSPTLAPAPALASVKMSEKGALAAASSQKALMGSPVSPTAAAAASSKASEKGIPLVSTKGGSNPISPTAAAAASSKASEKGVPVAASGKATTAVAAAADATSAKIGAAAP